MYDKNSSRKTNIPDSGKVVVHMIGLGALVKFTENEDGSTNWWKVLIVLAIVLAPALLRCIKTVDEGERGARTRWGRAIMRDAEGKKCSHAERPFCGCTYKTVNAGAHFVLFKVHSIKTISCTTRRKPLSTDELTHGGRNYDLAPVIRWHVSKQGDYAGRAMFNVFDPNKKDDKNTELIQLVDEKTSDMLNRAYAASAANSNGDPVFLTVADFEATQVDWLRQHAGVELDELLYPKHKLDNVERQKEGLVRIAEAIKKTGQVVIPRDSLPEGVRLLPPVG